MNAARRRRTRPGTSPAGVALGILIALGSVVLGCGEQVAQPKSPQALKDEGQQVFGTVRRPANPGGPGNPKANGAQSLTADNAWSIVLAVFRGEGADQAAAEALMRTRSEGGLPDAYMQARGPASVVAYGAYSGADDPRAQQDLNRLRDIVTNRLHPYALAFLSPPPTAQQPSPRDEYNLVHARALYGRDALYSLQVGVYARDDLKHPTEQDLAEVRRTAEEAAAKLRQEGELAFYYHSRSRSMVTVGVFDLSDFDPQTPHMQSQRLIEAKKRHPYNLYNGRGIREKLPGMREARLQPSNLVQIPDK